ncbi:2-succinyl-6-hydroxy-2,4-cyclohexadiene-1-carboxylate synthase [Rubripirellula lacrimiformis]|uniref:2-succinyl-6-hydroxy-2, 4-cyclohexadiene-1-carboxylate synthase n=2 Tax=Rubripirellula lacrimiformis TaxID=1930273 RepID=A0A517NBG4_9BACT|nr:2-succinyl-6-hydroxy-2,4-cyclohexadiene-1-carboxylate synthase [Rubripirellula lacrimiformis]
MVTAVGLAVSWYVAGALVAANHRVIGAPPADLQAKPFTIPSESGATIHGWHTSIDGSQGVIVLVHGIRGSRLSMIQRARWLHQKGYATVMIDLQSHGESTGETITIGQLEKHDVRAAVTFARLQHPDQPIGIIGVSLGGAATLLGSPMEVDAVVVESVYPDIDTAIHNRVAAVVGPLSWLPSTLLLIQLEPRLGIPRWKLRPIDKVAETGCPTLVMSGSDDRHTTAAETVAIFDNAQEPKELWLVDGAGHVDLHQADPAEYESRVGHFLDQFLRTDGTD